MRKIFFLPLFLWIAVFPFLSQAETMHYTIMTDDDLTVNALSANGVEDFLREKGSGYAGKKVTDTDGQKRLVSEIIYRAAKENRINSEALLALLQKESSGLTSKTTNDFAMGFGVCDSCSASEIEPYRGIAKQFRMAAEQLRYDFDILQNGGSTISGWKKDVPKTTIDGKTIVPETHATALMLSYNPFLGAYDGGDPSFGGVSLLRKIWDDYFANRGRIRYPNGTIFRVKGEKGYYLIQNDTIRKFGSKTIMNSMVSGDTVFITLSANVANDQYRFYEAGSTIKFQDSSVLQNKKTNDLYLLSDGKKRLFTEEGRKAYGYYEEQITIVSSKDLKEIPNGKPITGFIEFPGGAVVQMVGTDRYYYVNSDNTAKHPIKEKKLLDIRFSKEPILRVSKKRLKQYKTGQQALLQNGVLVTSKKTTAVYFIENKKRRRVESPAVLKKYGYTFEQVKTIPHRFLLEHPEGKELTLKKEAAKKTKK